MLEKGRRPSLSLSGQFGFKRCIVSCVHSLSGSAFQSASSTAKLAISYPETLELKHLEPTHVKFISLMIPSKPIKIKAFHFGWGISKSQNKTCNYHTKY